jgi:transcriptional regulator with XRE-family HTH domain
MSSEKPSGGSDVYVSQEGLEEVLCGLRRRRGITQKQVADEAGVSPAAIARIEKGDRRPSLQMLGKLAPVFGTTPEDLLEAAGRVADGSELDQVLDDLPAATGAAFSPAAEPRGGYSGPEAVFASAAPMEAFDAPAPPGPPLADLSLSGPRLQALAVADLLERVEDQEGATALVRDAIEWLADRGGSPSDVARLRQELREALRGPEPGREPVAAMPTGEVRYVFKQALARDERGQVWIDPLARARIGGFDQEDPRVERYDDGEIVVDLERLEDRGFDPREDRHRVKVTVEGDAGSSVPEPDLAELERVYAETVIEIHWPDRPHQLLEPRPEGVTDGEFPGGVDHIHVITAFNPRSRLLRRSENEERNRLLRADLDRAGLRYVEGVGRSPDSSWSEDSFAVIDADAGDILDLARRFQQNAIFEWTPDRRAILWSDPELAPQTHGWQVFQSGIIETSQ